MKTELFKILNLNKFFSIIQCNDQIVKYSLLKPTKILIQNIYSNWLQTILSKTQKHIPVYLNNKYNNCEKIPFGFINGIKLDNYQDIFEQNVDDWIQKNISDLKFNLIVPQQVTMQHFIQWQRYRKYWWSSITTTPSLFSIGDIKHEENNSSVNIVSKFPWGSEIVEKLTITSYDSIQNTSHLICTMPLERALFILLIDGLTNSTKEGYLRLHRKMTPYKMSFMLEYEGSKSENTLKCLANMLHFRLARNRISTWLPDFSLSPLRQLQENLQMGVAYNIVLSEKTLTDGVFHLLNSSTMLKEQIHVADFDKYATLICG